MSDRGHSYKVAAVRFERLLPAAPDRVWTFLTEAAKIPVWYGADGSIEPREGGAVSLMDGHIRGVVTQWKPPRKLAYTWNVFSPGETESAYPESYLTVELEPDGDATKLTLTHLPILERFEPQNAMGWHTFLDLVEASVKGEPVQPRVRYSQKNAALYGVDMSNLAR